MADDKHPPKEDKKPAKKELPWGLPAFLFLLFIAIGFGFAFMMEQLFGVRNAIDWFISMLFRLMGPILILAIVFYIFKGQGKPKEEHH